MKIKHFTIVTKNFCDLITIQKMKIRWVELNNRLTFIIGKPFSRSNVKELICFKLFSSFVPDYHRIIFEYFKKSLFRNKNKIKSGKNIMYTYTIMVQKANVYIIFLPDFINEKYLLQ